MSRRAAANEHSGPAPLQPGQLVGLPLAGLVMGPLLGLFYVQWLGWPLTLALGAGLSAAAAWLAGWIAYRSDFGGRQGLAGAALTLLFLVPLVAGVALLTLRLAGLQAFSALAVGTTVLSLSIAVFTGFRWQWAALQREGVDGAWARTNVDPDAARLRASALLAADPNAQPTSPWFVAALAANGPLVYSTWGVGDAQAAPVVLAVLAAISAWACVRTVGPMAARGAFVLQLERRHGRRIVHEHLEALQALRQEIWPSRWLMGPAQASAAGSLRRRSAAANAANAAKPAPLWQRAALLVLEIVAGLGFVGGATLAIVEAWPALDRTLRWDDYRPAEVVVESVEIASRRSQWLGHGRVDGRDVQFAGGELDALLGPPPATSSDARMLAARARLPLQAQALWNPQAQRRLIALDTPHEQVSGQARFAMGFAAAWLAVGALALWARRALAGRFKRAGL